MKVISFVENKTVSGAPAWRLTLELKPNVSMIITTYEDNYKTDLYYCVKDYEKYPKNTVFTFESCKWGNYKGVRLNRKLVSHNDSLGNFHHTTFYINDTPETIKAIMLKWCNWYVEKRLQL